MKAITMLLTTAVILTGCATETNRVTPAENQNEPITETYQQQLSKIVISKTTLEELKAIFSTEKLTLKENGGSYEIWELIKRGGEDDSNLWTWGVINHYKDQALDFRFEDGVLVSYNSTILN